VLQRVRNSVPWLEILVARMLVATQPRAPTRMPITGDRPIRLVDGTVVAKADKAARESGGVWRVHAVWTLNDERFSCFELTDEKEGERLDRAAVIPGEIRIADRAYLQPERIARVLADGGDVIIRAPWNGARWQDASGDAVDLTMVLTRAGKSVKIIDQPIWMALSGKTGAKPEPRLAVRLVALRKPPEATKKSIEKVVAEAARRGSTLQPGTIIAAEWTILITSLSAKDFAAAVIGDLYRLRRAEGARLRTGRIEVAFKHLKSGSGLSPPPGTDPRSAKAHILSHLLASLLTEPHLSAHFGDSPRRAAA
jgi:Transposase DDE domain